MGKLPDASHVATGAVETVAALDVVCAAGFGALLAAGVLPAPPPAPPVDAALEGEVNADEA